MELSKKKKHSKKFVKEIDVKTKKKMESDSKTRTVVEFDQKLGPA